MTETTHGDLPISPALLEILRDPVAVQDKEAYGDDPGHLDLVHNCWLVSKDTGYKYPIKDGIPVMLIEEGEKWKDTTIDDLPVPPPPLIPDPLPEPLQRTDTKSGGDGAEGLIFLVAAGIGLVVVVMVLRAIFRRSKS